MSALIFIIVTSLLCTAHFGDAVRCYHCYDAYNKTLSARGLDGADFGEKFVRCDKNKNNWNTYNCPPSMPICVIMSAAVKDHYEVARSCASRDFCSKYVPPSGVKLDTCRECNTPLCNDYLNLPDPDPPVGPVPLFTFNINIRLNLKRYPMDNSKGVK